MSTALIKELRARTGAGMMECKKALDETSGDLDKAIEVLRERGIAKAEKKSDREASEGLVRRVDADGITVLLEVACETDFVARNEDFQGLVDQLGQHIIAKAPANVEELLAQPFASDESLTVEETLKAAVGKIGENIVFKRFARYETDGVVGGYLHPDSRIGVLVELSSGDEELARDVAMHIAASSPLSITEDELDQAVLSKEADIYLAQAKEEGKPDNIAEKIVEGRLRKFKQEVVLLSQEFVKDPDKTVAELLAGAEVRRFDRFELGSK